MDVVKRKLQLVDMKVWMAVFVVFSFVCSGGFGIEDMVGGSGPGFTLILLITLPFVWGLPQALVCSELGSAIPEDGGLYRWSRRALGEFMGFQTGWWWVLSIFVDSAVYIALTVDYAQTWFHLTGLERWVLAVVLIAIFAYVNIRGLQLAAWVLVILQVIVLVPFVALARAGLCRMALQPVPPHPAARRVAHRRRRRGPERGHLDVLRLRVAVDHGRRDQAAQVRHSAGAHDHAACGALLLRALHDGRHGRRRPLCRLGHERQVRLHGRRLDSRRPDAALPVLRRHAGRQLRPLPRLPGGRRAALVCALQRQAVAEVPRQGESSTARPGWPSCSWPASTPCWCAGASPR